MCQAINNARLAYPGQTLDARGFSGPQICLAQYATTMLGYDTSGMSETGKLLLGNVTLYVDGPASNPYFEDNNGSTYGTPAIVIPNQFWGIQGLSRSATTIAICTGSGIPHSKCVHSFPQRKLTITGVSFPGSTPRTMRVQVSDVLTSTNIYVGEYVHITGSLNIGLPALKIQNVTLGVNNSFDVYVPPSYAPSCGAPCGNAYLMTPVIGFGPGGSSPNPKYLPSGSPNNNSFGQHVKDLSISLLSASSGSHGYLGAAGIQNVYCEETCGIDNVSINYFASVGLEDYSVTSQNAGPWTNIVVSTNSNAECDYGTTGVVLADTPDRGIDGWTITSPGTCNLSQQPVTAVLMDKPGTPILHGHNEGTRDGVLVGSQGAVLLLPGGGISRKSVGGVKIEELLGPGSGTPGTNVVHVSNVFDLTTSTPTVANVFRNVVQQTGGSTNAVQDDIKSFKCTDQAVSYYETDISGFPSTDCSLSSGTFSAFVLNNGTFSIFSNSSTVGSSMDATKVLSPLYTAATVVLQPQTDGQQAIQFKKLASSGVIVASIDTSTSGGQLAIGSASAPNATVDVAGHLFEINSSGLPIVLGGQTIVTVPGTVYNTTSGNTNQSVPQTQMTAGISGTHAYEFKFSVRQVNTGTTCTGDATVQVNLIYTDPNQAGTFTVLAIMNKGDGNSGTTVTLNHIGITRSNVASGVFNFTAKTSTQVQDIDLREDYTGKH